MILCGRFQQFFILQTPCKHLHQHPCVSGTLLQHAFSLVMSCWGLPSAVVIDLVGDPRFSLALYSQKQNAWPEMLGQTQTAAKVPIQIYRNGPQFLVFPSDRYDLRFSGTKCWINQGNCLRHSRKHSPYFETFLIYPDILTYPLPNLFF